MGLTETQNDPKIEVCSGAIFSNGYDVNQLNTEIASSSGIGSLFLHIRQIDGCLFIYFSTPLNASQKTELDQILGDHLPVGETTGHVFADSSILPHKVLNYNDDGTLLTSIQVYADVALTELRYTKTFNYTGELLTSILLERAADGAQFLQTLNYSGDTLVSITVQKVQ